MKPIVIVEKVTSDSVALGEQFTRSFDLLNLKTDFQKTKGIFIKPNLTYPSYKEGITTQRSFVESLVASLRDVNSSTMIYIGEGEGGYNSFSMTDAMNVMGFYEIEKNYPNVKVLNLSGLPRRGVELKVNGKPYSLDLPAFVLDDIDFSITCPLPKIHCMTKVTLSFKNQWGCLPDTMRLKNHYTFDEIIGQVCEKLKFRYAFLDGKYGLDRNGPMMGDPVEVNWYAASNSLGAFDMVISEMMGFNWREIGHLKMAERYGYLPGRDEIEVIGDVDSLKRKFTLKRNFWNYPALVAFHSKTLTGLVYLSGWSKMIHDVMYTFRKKPIS